MLQKGGRSGARIVEDLLRYVPGVGHFALSPLDAAKSAVAQPFSPLCHVNPSSVPVRVDSLAGDSSIVYLIYPDTFYHLEVHLKRGNFVGSRNKITEVVGGFDFHLRDFERSDNWVETYSFECSETCSELEVIVHPPLLNKDDLVGFSVEKIRQRYNAYTAGQELSPPCPTDVMCYNVLYSILTKVLREELSSISEDDSKLELFDVRLLDKIGFVYNKHLKSYVWPKDESGKKRKELWRWILEMAVRGICKQKGSPSSLHTFHERLVDGSNHLKRLLIGQGDETLVESFPQLGDSAPISTYAYDITNLDNRSYGNYVALGSTEYASNDILIRRYDLQVQNDSVNLPKYLEALDAISKLRQSEELQIKVVQVVSLEECSNEESRAAYEFFNVSPQDGADEEFFIDSYRQIIKQFPFRAAEARRALESIARDRDSDKLRNLLKEKVISDVADALDLLGLMPDADDDTVKRGFDMHFDTPQSKEALLVIAKSRMSFSLLSLYEDVTPPIEMTMESAYGMLGIDNGAEENLLLATFDVRLQDSPENVLELRRALTIIARDRNFQRILMFLTSGEIGDVVVDHSAPVGLRNIGNTCYLNSLLQYYYTIKPLREATMDYALMAMEEPQQGSRKIGGRVVNAAEVKRAGDFVALLAKLFYELGTSTEMCATPAEQLVTLAFGGDPDEIVEDIEVEESSWSSIEGAREMIDTRDLSHGEKDKEGAFDETLPHLESNSESHDVLMDNTSPIITTKEIQLETDSTMSAADNDMHIEDEPMQKESPKAERLTGKKRKITRRKTFYSAQQDITECISNVFFLLEAALEVEGVDDEDGEQLDLIKRLFYGKTSQTLETLKTNKKRTKHEWFSSLLVDVALGSRDIYDALDASFSEDLVTLDDGEAKRSVTISQAPEVLQIQIQRVQFDRKSGNVFKSLARLDFGEVIYMDRYLDQDPKLLDQRRKTAAQREKLAELKHELLTLEEKKSRLLEAMNPQEDSGAQLVIYNEEVARAKAREGLQINRTQEEVPAATVEESLIDIDSTPPAPDDDEFSVQLSVESSTSDSDTKPEQQAEIDEVSTSITEVQRQIEELKINIEEPYKDMTTHGYRIHAIFVHRGENVNCGHYWVYINDPKLEVFRKFDDESVSVVSREAVFDTSNDNATPYLLVFVREDKYDELVEAVHREKTTSD